MLHIPSSFQRYKPLMTWLIILVISLVGAILICNYRITSTTKHQIYTSIDSIPSSKTGLVLGASKKTSRGFSNFYFKYRMQAAYDLFKAGKVKFLLVSGDNHIKGYDEPSDMREALMALGVPDSCIVLDYAGFRTLDSVVRCREVFGEDSITIVSQEFHNQRALYIANKYGIKAIAFNAREVNKNYGLKTSIREYFARVKCVLDLYLLHTAPKFSGKKIVIG